jgi:hypothetical protein
VPSSASTPSGALPQRTHQQRRPAGERLIYAGDALPAPGSAGPFAEIYTRRSILIAPTEFAATAPLKVAAVPSDLRRVMPGFSAR